MYVSYVICYTCYTQCPSQRQSNCPYRDKYSFIILYCIVLYCVVLYAYMLQNVGQKKYPLRSLLFDFTIFAVFHILCVCVCVCVGVGACVCACVRACVWCFSCYLSLHKPNKAQCSTAAQQHSSTAQHSTAQQYSTAQHSTAQHSTAQHSTAQHSTAQHSIAQHNSTKRSNIAQ